MRTCGWLLIKWARTRNNFLKHNNWLMRSQRNITEMFQKFRVVPIIRAQTTLGLGGAGLVALYRLARPNEIQVQSQQRPSLRSDVVFDEIQERANTELELVKSVNSSFRFVISDGQKNGVVKKWTVDCKAIPPFIGEREGDVDVELMMTDADFMQIVAGKLRPDQAFMQGKLKIKGNLAKALKLRTLLKPGMLQAKL